MNYTQNYSSCWVSAATLSQIGIKFHAVQGQQWDLRRYVGTVQQWQQLLVGSVDGGEWDESERGRERDRERVSESESGGQSE